VTEPLNIGRHSLANTVLLAPMTGVTDLPFRRLVHKLGAGLVVSEMVASRELVNGRADVERRAQGAELDPFVIQLVGAQAHLMGNAARIAQRRGAQIIDINMGCPSREVTGKLSGSALMRDLDHAQSLIEAVVGACTLPVTLKMRLGWDWSSINAPELARRAQSCGVKLITVHARTRNQFFKDGVDWQEIAKVKQAVDIPVIVNGDIKSPDDARIALKVSKADGVMIGRGAYGAPWLPAQIAQALANGTAQDPPQRQTQRDIAVAHVEDMLLHYGSKLGLRNARKHIGWYIEKCIDTDHETAKAWRRHLCTSDNPNVVLKDFGRCFDDPARVPSP